MRWLGRLWRAGAGGKVAVLGTVVLLGFSAWLELRAGRPVTGSWLVDGIELVGMAVVGGLLTGGFVAAIDGAYARGILRGDRRRTH